MRELNPCPLLPESRITTLNQRPTKGLCLYSGSGARLVGRSLAELLCQLNIKPPWPNGQGAPLLRVRLWVRVPLGVLKHFFFQPSRIHLRQKNNTPCGTQTHNLQIRSLTRCSIAPTGPVYIVPWATLMTIFFCWDSTHQTKKKTMLQEGLEPPTLGLLDPCSTKLSYQSCTLHTLGIEPKTFTYSVRRSPNWATWALTVQVLEIGSKTNANGPLVKISTAKPKCSAVMQSIPVILVGAPRRVFFSAWQT